MLILVTGVAGFIGFHIAKKLLGEGYRVVGIDNLNSYYDVNLKKSRLDQLDLIPVEENFWKFKKIDIAKKEEIEKIFKSFNPEIVINLAAQAGVRYSLENPYAYIETNIVGFANLLECCKNYKIRHLIYASSSSVYGGNKNIPFSENDGLITL